MKIMTIEYYTFTYNHVTGMADMEYSIMERGPVIAMCMKVDPAPKPGYGYCQLKPAIMVNDGMSISAALFSAPSSSSRHE